MTAKKKKSTKMKGNCHFCGKAVDEDSYCWGCGHFVCMDCDESGPMGSHSIDDHKLGDEPFQKSV